MPPLSAAAAWTIAGSRDGRRRRDGCRRPDDPAAGTIAGAAARTIATGTKRGLTVVAAEVHAVRAAADVVALVEFVGDVVVVVAHTVAVIGVVLPVSASAAGRLTLMLLLPQLTLPPQ